MDTKKIRNIFFDYFKLKEHKIVDSAPITVKNDPSLMFTNAGMNQFKNIFLGDEKPNFKRLANTQKCLRVSGKHNDLEEVGIDKYHHTMFEMLGNWSFGDYFKEDAISWAWELLTKFYKLSDDRLYITIFGGDKNEGLKKDIDSEKLWLKIVDKNKIVEGSKKDNFWEMGETGPCGPCSEIHIDLRDKSEINKLPTSELINKDHPEVIEIWNLVFIEFNRKKDGSLEQLPNKHVDTGMGLERLSMALKGLKSTYDTDIFKNIIKSLELISNKKYNSESDTDIAFRVICDHIRAIVFTISDGAIPSNNKSGYVVRRILRRAIRYGYSRLNLTSPFLFRLVDSVVEEYYDTFENLKDQKDFIKSIIKEEEKTFLKTLEKGLLKIKDLKKKNSEKKMISGDLAFELYDTYGFPYDLTELIAREDNMQVDKNRFDSLLDQQRNRSRKSSTIEADDWKIVNKNPKSIFKGYDKFETTSGIIKYRQIIRNNKKLYQIVFSETPFYAESGGQIGDSGYFKTSKEKIYVSNTVKENDLIIHETDSLPKSLNSKFYLEIDQKRRSFISKNHSATHLLHSALRQVLGEHVVQKGSLVTEKSLRFDFSHFKKIKPEEIETINTIVNEKISESISVETKENMTIDKAKKMGALALFGEKYGDKVRVVIIDNKFSVELCGGTHVNNSSEIGLFKIMSESSISSGVRRIEAITSLELLNFTNSESNILADLKDILRSNDIIKTVKNLLKENKNLESKISDFNVQKHKLIKEDIKNNIEKINDCNLIFNHFDGEPVETLKKIAFEFDSQYENLIFLSTSVVEGKPLVLLLISKNIIKKYGLKANEVINKLTVSIDGAGGGQDFLATAGGKNTKGIDKVISEGRTYFNSVINN